ncbi:MAG: EAL domain-containing protein [Solirubrobacterales bacterium]|nr:EAL domain-containing protein [Solirubrobacterales bacterium]
MSLPAPAWKLSAYVWAVCLAGSAALLVLLLAGHGQLVAHAAVPSAALAALAVLGEFVPIRVFRRDAEGEITLSTAFAFAVLLDAGPLAATVALLAAGVAADLHLRKPPLRIWFNAAQYALSMAAAGAVLALLTDVPRAGDLSFAAAELPGIVAAGCVFFLVNSLLVATVIALAHGYAVHVYFRTDFAFVAASTGMALGLAPVAVLAAHFSLALLPALALPLAGVHRAARQAQELEHQSRHDALTGLPNRVLLRGRLEEAVRLARRDGGRAVVLLLDLDHFKEINDTLGHGHGDLLLREVAQRLRDALREEDLVARLGGDEFAVLLGETGDLAGAVALARRLLGALEAPVDVEGVTLRVEGSIGLAAFPEHGDDVDTVLRRADIAMYVAKGGKTGVEVYDPRQERHSPARLGLAGELRRALDGGELVVHFQPEAELATGRVVAAEALVRWAHPRRGLVAPGEFVPLAENTGLIGPLTLVVLDAALDQRAGWQDAGHDLDVSVNLSTRSLMDRRLRGHVEERLAQHGIAPERLELEITESMVAADPVRAMRTLADLRDLGVRLALDDFGTGFSSLANLRDLPVTSLKVDKSFILGMAERHQDAVIVTATVDLARRLGLRVVAEGVETAALWDRLRAIGCDLAQGYHVSRPVDGDRFTAWLAGRATAAVPVLRREAA